jgi:hypothetical protein
VLVRGIDRSRTARRRRNDRAHWCRAGHDRSRCRSLSVAGRGVPSGRAWLSWAPQRPRASGQPLDAGSGLMSGPATQLCAFVV